MEVQLDPFTNRKVFVKAGIEVDVSGPFPNTYRGVAKIHGGRRVGHSGARNGNDVACCSLYLIGMNKVAGVQPGHTYRGTAIRYIVPISTTAQQRSTTGIGSDAIGRLEIVSVAVVVRHASMAPVLPRCSSQVPATKSFLHQQVLAT